MLPELDFIDLTTNEIIKFDGIHVNVKFPFSLMITMKLYKQDDSGCLMALNMMEMRLVNLLLFSLI